MGEAMDIPRICLRLDQVASWRQMRRSDYPEPLAVAQAAGVAGADLVSCSYHSQVSKMQLRDLQLLRQAAGVPLQIELPATQESLRVAYDVKPDCIVVVPDSDEDSVVGEGVDVSRNREQLRSFVQNLRDADIRAGVLLEPDLDQVRSAHRADVHQVMINTRRFAQAHAPAERRHELERIVDVVKTASRLGLEVSAGGGLDLRGLRLLGAMEEVGVLVVGHWLLSRALFVGLREALQDLARALSEGPRRGS